MKMLKVMEKRRSVREYKDRMISMEELDQLMRILEQPIVLAEGQKAELLFIEDGEMVCRALEGVAGYHGVMIKAPHYFALLADDQPHSLTHAAYLAEWFVLNATKLNLGTCWIETIDKSDTAKRLLQLEDHKRLVALIAIGHPKAEPRLSNIFKGKEGAGLSPYTETGYSETNPEYAQAPVSARLSIEEIVYLKQWGQPATVETLETYGLAEAFYYMRLAPSWGTCSPGASCWTGSGSCWPSAGTTPIRMGRTVIWPLWRAASPCCISKWPCTTWACRGNGCWMWRPEPAPYRRTI